MLKQPEVSQLIRELRQLTSLSQEQLAATLGVADCTVNRWENGHIQPSASTFMSQDLPKHHRESLNA